MPSPPLPVIRLPDQLVPGYETAYKDARLSRWP